MFEQRSLATSFVAELSGGGKEFLVDLSKDSITEVVFFNCVMRGLLAHDSDSTAEKAMRKRPSNSQSPQTLNKIILSLAIKSSRDSRSSSASDTMFCSLARFCTLPDFASTTESAERSRFESRSSTSSVAASCGGWCFVISMCNTSAKYFRKAPNSLSGNPDSATTSMRPKSAVNENRNSPSHHSALRTDETSQAMNNASSSNSFPCHPTTVSLPKKSPTSLS
mmetsp:Transcript_46335/g.123071  ORF Transcript_46335/g.123071 Transcript_46335/m.123071 type:complete len:223 (+) Transcript_46335:1406-2074(+)